MSFAFSAWSVATSFPSLVIEMLLLASLAMTSTWAKRSETCDLSPASSCCNWLLTLVISLLACLGSSFFDKALLITPTRGEMPLSPSVSPELTVLSILEGSVSLRTRSMRKVLFLPASSYRTIVPSKNRIWFLKGYVRHCLLCSTPMIIFDLPIEHMILGRFDAF